MSSAATDQKTKQDDEKPLKEFSWVKPEPPENVWITHITETIALEEIKTYEDIKNGVKKHQYVPISGDADKIITAVLNKLWRQGFIAGEKGPDLPIRKTSSFPSLETIVPPIVFKSAATIPTTSTAVSASISTSVTTDKEVNLIPDRSYQLTPCAHGFYHRNNGGTHCPQSVVHTSLDGTCGSCSERCKSDDFDP